MRTRVLFLLLAGSAFGQQIISTVAGTHWVFPNAPQAALQAPLSSVLSSTVDPQGRLVIVDGLNHIVARVDAAGVLTVIAGNGVPGFSGDGGDALRASLNRPSGAVYDSRGNLYIADANNRRVRRVTPAGVITTIAGNGNSGATGDGGPATAAALSPFQLTFDGADRLYITGEKRVRRVGTDGIISTVAGSGNAIFNGEGRPALQTGMDPNAIAIEKNGAMIVSDGSNIRVYRIGTDGIVTSIAGTGSRGFAGDGGPSAPAAITNVEGIAIDSAGNIYLADTSNRRIRRITPAGVISTVAGGGTTTVGTTGVEALKGALGFVSGIAFDSRGRLYIPNELDQLVQVLSEDQRLLTKVAGGGGFKAIQPNMPATLVSMTRPTGVAVGPDGSVYYAELEGHRIGKIAPGGTVSLVAGNGVAACCGDGGPATSGTLGSPNSLAFAPDGAMIITDGGSQKIRKIASNVISSLAGQTFATGFSGDGGPAAQSVLFNPWGMAVDGDGNIYFSDRGNHRVRKIDTRGVISTVAGNGVAAYAGDGGPATAASLNAPQGVCISADGELLITDFYNRRVRAVSADGRIRTFAGNGTFTYGGDGGPALAAGIGSPFALARDAAGNIYISHSTSIIRRVDRTGTITTIAGLNVNGFSGDGGPPARATLFGPYGLATDAAGNLYIADTDNNRIRVIRSNVSLTTTLAPSPVNLTAVTGTANPTSARVTVGSTVSGLPFQTAVTYGQTPNGWLTVTASGPNAPATLTLAANASNLGAGRYTATVNVTTNPPGASNPVSVVLNVTDAPARLSLSAEALTFSRNEGAAPDISALEVRNSGGGLLTYQASATTSGGTWLKVSAAGGALRAGQVESVSVTADPAGLTAGTYLGSVVVTVGTAKTVVPVTLSVRSIRRTILVSQTGLTFTAVAGGGAPTPQKIGILNIGSGALNWQAAGKGRFAQLSPAAGTVNQPWLEVDDLTVGVAHAGLAPGQYYDQIEITGNADNSPQLVTVLLNVLPEGTNPGPEVIPSGMIFITKQGENPGSQLVTLNHLGKGAITYDSAQLGSWYEAAPSSGRAQVNDPRSIVVQPALDTLTPGVRRGALTFQVQEDGSIRTVNLLSVVAPAGAGVYKNGERSAASCGSPSLRVESTTLRDGFAVRAGEAVTIEVKSADECGNLLTPLAGGTEAQVVARPENGDPQVNLAHVGNGVWRGSWRPVRAAGNTRLTVVAIFLGTAADVLAGRSQAGKVELSGTVLEQGTGASAAPILTAGGVVHAASFETGVPIAPGSLITLYGARLANAAGQAAGVPLPSQLNGTEVRLGNRALPLLFTSDGQLNAQVPYDVPVDTQHQISVKRGEAIAVPETLTVSSAQPGIFTKSQTGSGQGAIVKQDGVTLAQPGTPAARGEVVVIYCSGLGPVSPAVEAGRAAPSNPLSRTVNPVTVTIGGQSAPVLFAGLSPGFSGLYQINATVPAGVTPGDAVAVQIEAAGQKSREVTIAVR